MTRFFISSREASVKNCVNHLVSLQKDFTELIYGYSEKDASQIKWYFNSLNYFVLNHEFFIISSFRGTRFKNDAFQLPAIMNWI